MPGRRVSAWSRSALAIPLLLVVHSPLPAPLIDPPPPPACAANAAESPAPEIVPLLDPERYRHHRWSDMALVTGSESWNTAYLHPVAVGPFVRMRNAAMAEGIEVIISSGWRSWDRQLKAHRLFLRTGRNLSGDRVPYIAHPAESRHPAGTAVDLRIEPDSPLPAWLEANAACFGFVNTRGDEPWEYQFTGLGTSEQAGPVR